MPGNENPPQAALQMLDNPIWQALNTRQSHLAEGDSLAKRFSHEIGPLAGMAQQSEAAYATLASLTKPQETLVLFLEEPPRLSNGWNLQVGGHVTQMICEERLAKPEGFPLETLGEADVAEMLALTRLTKPGPFRQKTIDLDGYVGIREAGRLVAMAGERLRLEGYTEISAVCTHPDFQGRGYARALIATVANQIASRGEIPFLHTGIDNIKAIRLYEKLGFQQRKSLHLAVISRI